MDAAQRALLLRIQDLERAQVRHRLGVISDLDPLSVKLGGSDVAYTGVQAVDSQGLVVGDVVSCLTFGNDLIVLGRVSATPGGAGRGAFFAYNTNAQSLAASGTGAALQLDTEDFDVDGWWDTSTYRYTPQVPGIYMVGGAVRLLDAINDSEIVGLDIGKNSGTVTFAQLGRTKESTSSGSTPEAWGSALVELNGDTDYVSFIAYQNDALTRRVQPYISGTNSRYTYGYGYLVRAT